MDNAGGHGTKNAIETYTNQLKEEHNVVIIHQIPRSPETNILDLGVWCSLQSVVEKEHQGKTKSSVDALYNTIDQVWKNRFGSEIMEKVYERWEKILQIILHCQGDNSQIDCFRGKKNVLANEMLNPGAEDDENEESVQHMNISDVGTVEEDEDDEDDLEW